MIETNTRKTVADLPSQLVRIIERERDGLTSLLATGVRKGRLIHEA